MSESLAPSTEEERLAEHVREEEYSRFHPLTPLVTGWKALAALVAFVGFQSYDVISEVFENGFVTLRNISILGAVGGGFLLVSLVVGFLAWRATMYAVNDNGVFLRTRFISTSRRITPRERIDSVSIERPLLARVLGLSKVKVELAGGGDSHIELDYLSASRAEEIYSRVLELAKADPAKAPGTEGRDAMVGASHVESEAPAVENASGGNAIHSLVYDSDSSGTELARIPTARLLKSMALDLSLWIGGILSLLFGIAWLVWMFWGGEISFSIPALFALLPVIFALPRMVFEKIDEGWGFISRATGSGLRARRGLLNSRSENLSAAKIQQVEISQPILWRPHNWAQVRVSTAGSDSLDDETGKVLPVGTIPELTATLGHLLAPVGPLATEPGGQTTSAETDTALLLHYLTQKTENLEGTRPFHWSTPIARRRTVVTLTEHAVLMRRGLISHRLEVLPRERIQGVQLEQGPFARRWGMAHVTVSYAGGHTSISDIPAADAMELMRALARDAGTSRRYSEKSAWLQPRLKAAGDASAQDVQGEAPQDHSSTQPSDPSSPPAHVPSVSVNPPAQAPPVPSNPAVNAVDMERPGENHDRR